MSKEIWINLPKEFTGEQNNLNSFLQDVDLYLKLNSEIYSTDNKKIVFTLSFSTDGPAKVWKESFLTKKFKDGTYKLGTITNFIEALQVAFAPTDAGESARAVLQSLKQTGTANECVWQKESWMISWILPLGSCHRS